MESRSRSESESEKGVKLVVVDAKPERSTLEQDEGEVTLTGGLHQ